MSPFQSGIWGWAPRESWAVGLQFPVHHPSVPVPHSQSKHPNVLPSTDPLPQVPCCPQPQQNGQGDPSGLGLQPHVHPSLAASFTSKPAPWLFQLGELYPCRFHAERWQLGTSLLTPARNQWRLSMGSVAVEGCGCEVGTERPYLLLEQPVRLGKKSSKADKLLGSQVFISGPK